MTLRHLCLEVCVRFEVKYENKLIMESITFGQIITANITRRSAIAIDPIVVIHLGCPYYLHKVGYK